MGMPQQHLVQHYGDAPGASYVQPASPLQPLPTYNYPPVTNAPPMAPSMGAPSMYSTEEAPMDEAMLARPVAMDPPDEPPSLSKRSNQDGSNSFSSGDHLGTFSSEHQSMGNQLYSSEDNHGESYEEPDFYPGAPAPPKNENRDYFGHEAVDGGYYNGQPESALGPDEYNSHMGPAHAPQYLYDEHGKAMQHQGSHMGPGHEVPYHYEEPRDTQRQQGSHARREGPYGFGEPVDTVQLHHMPQTESERKEEQYRYEEPGGVHEPLSPHSGPGHEKEHFRYDESPDRFSQPEDVQQQESSFESYGENVDQNKRGRSDLPPTSPQSQTGSEQVSHTSSAMRGAQELLKRNRQKRLEMAARHTEGTPLSNALRVQTKMHRPDPVLHPDKDVISPQSATTWESSSEVTSVVSGTSSAWTEGSANGDRSSRRALILQMAKARMKKNNTPKPAGASPVNVSIAEDEEEKKLDSAGEEDMALDVVMSRTNSLNESGTDIDISISQDLD